jgi:nitrite reductase (NADH) large subunit
MYYVFTADRLQRTAPWQEAYEGGLDALKKVIFDDSLGITADLDAAIANHVGGYEDEWAATLHDPEKLRKFAAFVNAPDTADPDLMYVEERGQLRPARESEKTTIIAGDVLPVRRMEDAPA